MGVRRLHLPLATGGAAGIDAVGPVARLHVDTAVGAIMGHIVAVPDGDRLLLTFLRTGFGVGVAGEHYGRSFSIPTGDQLLAGDLEPALRFVRGAT